jgi:hypothetical protein
MPSLGIAPNPGGAPGRWTTGSRTSADFMRISGGSLLYACWRLGSGNSALAISRGFRSAPPYAWARPPLLSWHAIFPFTFQIQVSHQTQEYPPNSSRLNREYNRAPRGAARAQAAIASQEPGERKSLGVGEGRLDHDKGSGWGGSGHRAPPGRAETRRGWARY